MRHLSESDKENERLPNRQSPRHGTRHAATLTTLKMSWLLVANHRLLAAHAAVCSAAQWSSEGQREVQQRCPAHRRCRQPPLGGHRQSQEPVRAACGPPTCTVDVLAACWCARSEEQRSRLCAARLIVLPLSLPPLVSDFDRVT